MLFLGVVRVFRIFGQVGRAADFALIGRSGGGFTEREADDGAGHDGSPDDGKGFGWKGGAGAIKIGCVVCANRFSDGLIYRGGRLKVSIA